MIEAAVQCLLTGGVLAYPAEHCFGFGCLPDNDVAIKRILRIKNRSENKGLIIVGDSLAQLDNYINWPALTTKQQQQVLEQKQATTWLVPVAEHCKPLLKGRHAMLAIRITCFKPIIDLCLAANSALVSTSANRSGMPALKTAKQVKQEFNDEVDYILDLPVQGLLRPSTIINAITNQVIRA